ncbi:MAG TPA: SDR family oxidoreductase [Verrucomicrobiae bacterium]|nr:SDR family oxidoreductase [Verrucomicrobiae bacterium]
MIEIRTNHAAWVTGAAGLIGSYLVRHAAHHATGFSVRGLARGDLDLLDSAAVRERFHRERPRLVVHCAALSQSPACEQDPELAWKLNFEVTRLLADLCSNIPLLFFSTDLVFDGTRGGYQENDSVNPLSVYGATKVAAERAVLANPLHLVVRTSLNGGISKAGNRGFNEQLRRGFEAGRTATLFVDEFRSPIAAEETARAAWELIVQRRSGIFHVAGAERLSRWEIGRLLARCWPNLDARIEAASLSTYKGAPRAPDTSLDCSKASAVLSRPLPAFSEWLKNHAHDWLDR